MSKKPNPFKRHKARRFAVQALYQWHISHNDLNMIEKQFLQHEHIGKADLPYFQELLQKIPANCQQIDDAFSQYLDRAITSLDPIELTVLRIGTYELCYRPEIPYRVIINEAVELAKVFGAEDGHKFVNGILDKLAYKQRAVERGIKH